MVNTNAIIRHVKELCELSPRIGENEAVAREYLVKTLKQSDQKIEIHTYSAKIPNQLKTDNKGNVIFNDALKSIASANIIIGNLTTADTLICAHYDSLWGGAVDNAAAVALLLEYTKQKPDNVAIVLLGCEEAGSEPPTYWAHGSKMLASDHYLAHIKKIIILECLGSSLPEVERGEEISDWKYDKSDCRNFPKNKCILINGDLNIIMKNYHVKTDTPGLLKPEHITAAWEVIRGAVAQSGSALD